MQSHSVPGLDKQAIETSLLSKRKMVVGVWGKCLSHASHIRRLVHVNGRVSLMLRLKSFGDLASDDLEPYDR